MLSYLPTLDPEGKVKPEFNLTDFTWIYGYVTYADLLKYADRYVSNVFFATQQFTSIIFNVSINGVTEQVFSYLQNVSSDIQSQFNALQQKTTAQTYSSSNSTTTFAGKLATPVFILNNVNLDGRISTIETNVTTLKTKTTNQTFSSNTTSFSGILSTPKITLNGTDLNTRLTNNETATTSNTTDLANIKPRMTTAETNITSNTTEINALKPRLTTAETNITNIQTNIETINTSLATKAIDNQVVHISGNESISGIKTFANTPVVGLYNIATTYDITTAINNLVGGAGSAYDTLVEIQTLLQGDANSISTILSTMVNLTGTQTISGLKTFSSLITGASMNITGNTTFGTNSGNSATIKASATFQSPITFASTLNNISVATFAFLSGVSSNIQTQFNSLYTKLTNYSYDATTSTQAIISKLAVFDTLTTNTITVNNIVNNSSTSNTLFATTMTCKSFKCIDLYESLPIPVVYITNLGIQYPIMRSGLIANLSGFDITQAMYITVAPKYQIVFFDDTIGLALARIYNPTTDYIYNIGINFTTQVPTSYKISLMN